MKPGNATPINGTAARVIAAGESFNYRPVEYSRDSVLPLPVREITDDVRANPCFRDLTGQRMGRIAVIGLAEGVNGRWVCRCACGVYLIRKTPALTPKHTSAHACDQCYLLARSKAKEFLRRTGKHRETQEFLA